LAVPIPDFREDGYLPDGVHQAAEPEAVFRFGASTARRRSLVLRLRRWLDLARAVSVSRFLVDGSFVTSKAIPGDIDAVVLLTEVFHERLAAGDAAALELRDLITERSQGDLFAAEDAADWSAWVEFFTRTREADGRRKGVVEVLL
jgi:hypothetical protein